MNTQTAYEAIRSHFSQPDARYGFDARLRVCQYRTENGTTCAFGCLLPDELYSPDIEGNGVESLFWASEMKDLERPCSNYDLDALRAYFADVDTEFLAAAQTAHDACATSGPLSEFIEQLDNHALEFGLTVPS